MEPWKLEPARDLGQSLSQSFKSLDRENGLIASGLHVTWWAGVRLYLAMWHRLRIRGREHLPAKPPFVIVANHASHLDALALAAPLPWQLRDRIFPIAAGDVFFETPMMSAFAAMLLNALPMWRKKCGPHALKALRERLLGEPCAYILFPEGARTRDGAMLPFKVGLGMLIAETDVPIVPCYLTGTFAALSPEHRWPRPEQISLDIGPPLRFANVANDRRGWQEIAERLQEAVGSLAPKHE